MLSTVAGFVTPSARVAAATIHSPEPEFPNSRALISPAGSVKWVK